MRTVSRLACVTVSMLALALLISNGPTADASEDDAAGPEVLQPEPLSQIEPPSDATDDACACDSVPAPSTCHCEECCSAHHVGPVRRVLRGEGHVGTRLSSMAHSGQPLIDPWARGDWRAAQAAARQSWHAGYYHTGWGVPVALMVPPTARMQTRWSWGVAQATTVPIYHQFERPYPTAVVAGEGVPGVASLPTPRWPSHTDQFGVYYVRGPW
jgi:hypothetical protein